MRLVLTGGGTGGHIMPAIAVAEQALASGSVEALLFVGASDGLEQKLVPMYGFNIETLPVGRVRGMNLKTRVMGLAGLAASLPAAARILSRFNADVVIGTGGYASAPTVMAAAAKGLKTAVLEQNTLPGKTTRVLSRAASRVCLSFPMTSGYVPSHKVEVTGNPVRQPFVQAGERRAAATVDRKGFSVLVLGGSQGALFLNTTVARCLAQFARAYPHVTVVHQAGAGRTDEAAGAYEGVDNAQVVGFIDDVASRLEQATLVISRAGATTIAELAVVGAPSLLIPFPFAVDNHQEWNAGALEKVGAARMYLQQNFKEGKLLAELERLHADRDELLAMERRAREFGIPDAARRVLAAVEGLK